MSGQIIKRLKPEDEELLRKREELASVRATLAELELELVDLRGQLAAFEGRYLRQVGSLYAELDEWKARLAELQARLNPSPASRADAETPHHQANRSNELLRKSVSLTESGPEVSRPPATGVYVV
jgi:chromosome segregation ATPase